MLLHGFPSSSHMFRNLIPMLADRYHVVAPDLPGFGFSEAPDRGRFEYTFDHLAKIVGGLRRSTESPTLCDLRFRLRRARRPSPGPRAPRTHHRDHFAEWQRLRGRPERGMEPDPEILEGADRGQPGRPARFPQAGGDPLAVPPWGLRRGRRGPGVLHPRLGAPWTSRERRNSARPVSRLRQQRRALSRGSRPISASTSRRSWLSGARTIPFSCRRAPRRSSATCRSADVRLIDTGHFALETHAREVATAIREFLGKTHAGRAASDEPAPMLRRA